MIGGGRTLCGGGWFELNGRILRKESRIPGRAFLDLGRVLKAGGGERWGRADTRRRLTRSVLIGAGMRSWRSCRVKLQRHPTWISTSVGGEMTLHVGIAP